VEVPSIGAVFRGGVAKSTQGRWGGPPLSGRVRNGEKRDLGRAKTQDEGRPSLFRVENEGQGVVGRSTLWVERENEFGHGTSLESNHRRKRL